MWILSILKIAFGFYSGLSSQTKMVLEIAAAVVIFLLWFHHSDIKGEDIKISAQTDKKLQKISEVQHEERNNILDGHSVAIRMRSRPHFGQSPF